VGFRGGIRRTEIDVVRDRGTGGVLATFGEAGDLSLGTPFLWEIPDGRRKPLVDDLV
jgi:hypothetical protein